VSEARPMAHRTIADIDLEMLRSLNLEANTAAMTPTAVLNHDSLRRLSLL
jgi:hypothetical protein